MLASYSDAIRLIGISTIAGNQSIEKTTTNALQALNMAGLIGTTAKEPTAALDLDLGDCMAYGGLTVPILKGRSRPLIRQARICDEIHGESGLEGSHLPTLSSQAVAFTNKINSQTKHFTTIMYETFKKSDHGITLIATGPLTNIALLILNYPDVVEYISKIVLMGGAIGIAKL
jgi:inosine-uridine nucleoside N-ribohydrolase